MVPIIQVAPPAVTLEEFKMFHEIERALYFLLTMQLWRNPHESMMVMALWVWLQQTGFNNVVEIISSLPRDLINEIAEEAMTCINYLLNPNQFNPSPYKIDLQRTENLLGNDLSQYFSSENREKSVLGMKKAFAEVCSRALQDLKQRAIERNAAWTLAQAQSAMSSIIEPGFSRLNLNNFDRINPQFDMTPEIVHPDDRTLFATFSKGYPVPERDIRELFSMAYGDCIESLHMQDVRFGEQSLYARIVFYTPNLIEAVLNGAEKGKFTINGKHIWIRKFVPKRRR